jgi:hypothetical protein
MRSSLDTVICMSSGGWIRLSCIRSLIRVCDLTRQLHPQYTNYRCLMYYWLLSPAILPAVLGCVRRFCCYWLVKRALTAVCLMQSACQRRVVGIWLHVRLFHIGNLRLKCEILHCRHYYLHRTHRLSDTPTCLISRNIS